jgi:hypothetical protein
VRLFEEAGDLQSRFVSRYAKTEEGEAHRDAMEEAPQTAAA